MPARVVRLLLGGGLRLVLIGGAIGLALAAAGGTPGVGAPLRGERVRPGGVPHRGARCSGWRRRSRPGCRRGARRGSRRRWRCEPSRRARPLAVEHCARSVKQRPTRAGLAVSPVRAETADCPSSAGEQRARARSSASSTDELGLDAAGRARRCLAVLLPPRCSRAVVGEAPAQLRAPAAARACRAAAQVHAAAGHRDRVRRPATRRTSRSREPSRRGSAWRRGSSATEKPAFESTTRRRAARSCACRHGGSPASATSAPTTRSRPRVPEGAGVGRRAAGSSPARELVGIYWDDQAHHAARSHPLRRGSLRRRPTRSATARVSRCGELPGGDHAVMRCHGSPSDRRRSYDLLYGRWLPERGAQARRRAADEDYIAYERRRSTRSTWSPTSMCRSRPSER